MTALVERVEVRAPATVLRRVDCDARDAAILCAVLRGARTFRDIGRECGFPWSNVFYRVRGYDRKWGQPAAGNLIERGLITGDPARFRVLLPGPKLAGIDHDWPLELVEVEL
jgi:hypothetical protein